MRIKLKIQGTATIPTKLAGVVRIRPRIAGTMASGVANRLAGAIRIKTTVSGSLVSTNVLRGAEIRLKLRVAGTAQSENGLSGAVRVRLKVRGTAAAQVKLSGAVRIGLRVQGAATQPVGVIVSCWLMNTATGGHSRYDNFAFNSFFRLGNSYYATSDSGISRLAGALAASVAWRALSAVTRFGVAQRKNVPDARITLRTDGDIALRVVVDEQLERSQIMLPSDDRQGLHARRVKLPRGIFGTEWQFEVSGIGVNATIDSLEVDPVVRQRT